MLSLIGRVRGVGLGNILPCLLAVCGGPAVWVSVVSQPVTGPSVAFSFSLDITLGPASGLLDVQIVGVHVVSGTLHGSREPGQVRITDNRLRIKVTE